jgi:hypothetical protein
MYVLYVYKLQWQTAAENPAMNSTLSVYKAVPELLKPECENSAFLSSDVRPRNKIRL